MTEAWVLAKASEALALSPPVLPPKDLPDFLY